MQKVLTQGQLNASVNALQLLALDTRVKDLLGDLTISTHQDRKHKLIISKEGLKKTFHSSYVSYDLGGGRDDQDVSDIEEVNEKNIKDIVLFFDITAEEIKAVLQNLN